MVANDILLRMRITLYMLNKFQRSSVRTTVITMMKTVLFRISDLRRGSLLSLGLLILIGTFQVPLAISEQQGRYYSLIIRNSLMLMHTYYSQNYASIIL